MESYVIQLAVNKREGFSIEFVAQQELLNPETMEQEAEQLKSLLFDSLPAYTMDQLRDKINERYRSYDKVKDQFQEILRMLMDDDDVVADWAKEKSELDGWIHIDQGLPEDGEFVMVYDHVEDRKGYGKYDADSKKWSVDFEGSQQVGGAHSIVSHWKDFPDVTGLQRDH